MLLYPLALDLAGFRRSAALPIAPQTLSEQAHRMDDHDLADARHGFRDDTLLEAPKSSPHLLRENTGHDQGLADKRCVSEVDGCSRKTGLVASPGIRQRELNLIP